jgi:hypothetical protein
VAYPSREPAAAQKKTIVLEGDALTGGSINHFDLSKPAAALRDTARH